MTREEAIERIEEAIERIIDIKNAAWGYHIGGEVLGIPYSEFINIMEVALSALQAENEKLRRSVWIDKSN